VPARCLDDDKISECIETKALFTTRCDEFVTESWVEPCFIDPHLRVGLTAFQKMLLHGFISEVNIDAFEVSPICTAMRMLLGSDPESRNGWRKLIHQLLELGPDLQPWEEQEDGTILDPIMDIANSPFESHEVGEEWLAILADHGIDIDEHLRTELTYYQRESLPISMTHSGRVTAFMVNGHWYDRYRYLIFSDKTPRISWDWYIDSAGHASQALYEFRNLGPVKHNPGRDYDTPDAMCNWPYFYPRWESCRRTLYWHTASEASKGSMRVLIGYYEKRFERRWVKKVKKWRKVHGIGDNPGLPGAWID
jgi:hypothetical protein